MREKPFIFANMVMSVDGRIDPPGGQIRILSSEADRKNMDTLRAGADAIFVGAKTFCQPNAHITVRKSDLRQKRKKSGEAPNPTVVTLSKTGKSLLRSKLLKRKDFSRIIFLGIRANDSAISQLSKFATVYVVKKAKIPLKVICKILAQDHKVKRLLIEGGAELNSRLIKEELIDQIHLTIAPILLGGLKAKRIIEGINVLKRLKLAKVRKSQNDIFLVYKVKYK